MVRSLQDYKGTIALVNLVVSSSYVLIKYIAGPVIWIVLEMVDGRRRRGRQKKKCGAGHLGKFAKITLQPMQAIIFLLFGEQLPIKRHADDRDSNNVPNVTLDGKRLSYGATAVFFIIISTFWVLALGSGLNASLLSMTHTCDEDWNIDCYPVLLEGANGTGLNITTTTPIKNCSHWRSEEVADRVAFECYQYILNAEKFLAVIGGLLAIFIYAMKTAVTFLRFLSVCCLGEHKTERNSLKGKHRRRLIYVSRIMMAILAAISEIVLEILGNIIYGARAASLHFKEHVSALEYFLAKNTLNFLLVFGVLSTLLWLPWEDYATDDEEEDCLVSTPDTELYTPFIEGGPPQESEEQLKPGDPPNSGLKVATAALLETT